MPIDPITAATLTYEQAVELVALDIPLHLPALEKLSPLVARILASANHGIVLRNLPALTVAAAEALAFHKWGLHLTGLVSISRHLGDALAQHIGPLEFGPSLKELQSPRLAKRIAKQSRWEITLNGLESLTPEIARALAYRGPRTDLAPTISLNGLRRLSAETAAELVEYFFTISLHSLCDGRCALEQGAGEALAATDNWDHLKTLLVGDDIAGFLSQNYPERLLSKGIRSLNNLDNDGNRNRNYLNLDELASITPMQARAISEFSGDCIVLSGLEEIGPDVAKELTVLWNRDIEVTINPTKLIDPALVPVALRGLPEGDLYWEWEAAVISPEVAVALASEATADALLAQGYDQLMLPRLRHLRYEVAVALASTSLSLHLDGITELSPEVARVLATHQGPCLTMNGLGTISDATAREIAKHPGVLELDGLRSLSPAAARALSQKITWPK
jgi:hypothetical protein